MPLVVTWSSGPRTASIVDRRGSRRPNTPSQLLPRTSTRSGPARRGLAGTRRHRRVRRRDLFEPSARHELAVVAGVVLPRKRGVRRVARVARNLAHLRARVAERDTQQPGPEPGRDRVHARSAVEPERRLVHDPTLHPLSGEGGEIRLGVRELSPGGHDRRSLPACSTWTLPGRAASRGQRSSGSGAPCGAERARHALQLDGPISVNVTDLPSAASTTSLVTNTSTGLAYSAILAAMLTVRPK